MQKNMRYKQLANTLSAVLAVAALLPLVSAFFPFSQVQINLLGIHLPSEDIVVILGALFLTLLYLVLPGNVPMLFRTQCGYLTCFFVICLLSALFSWDASQISALYLLGRMASYYYYANALVGIVLKQRIDLCLFAVKLTKLFLALVALIVIYNFVAYHVPFEITRLQWPGIGAVIAGCTAATGIGFILFFEKDKGKFPHGLSFFGILLLLLLSVCSQSRAGVYVSFALVLYRFFPRRNAAFSLLCILGTAIVVLLFDPVGYISQTRMGMLDSTRFETWRSAVAALLEGGLLSQLLGYGFGAVFPYVEWSSAYANGEIARGITDGAWNQFAFHSHVMLVQPHNTFVYFLLEIGIVGALLFLGYFVFLFGSICQSKAVVRIRRFGILLTSALLLNCFDSIFVISAASSFWWILILLAFSELTVDCKESN